MATVVGPRMKPHLAVDYLAAQADAGDRRARLILADLSARAAEHAHARRIALRHPTDEPATPRLTCPACGSVIAGDTG